MRNFIAVALMAVLLTGCATYGQSVPNNYVGPQALVKDTVIPYDESKADFFYVTHVDTRELENSLIQTRQRNAGRGLMMSPYVISNAVPAMPITLVISARTAYAAPIQEQIHALYQITGPVSFTPEANKVYVVRGTLTESYSAVWIEEEDTHKVVGNKVELNGSSAVGFWQKSWRGPYL